jgi:AraC-like DNA-binding protein
MAYTQDNFDWQAYINSGQAGSGVSQGSNADAAHEGVRAYQDYVAKGSTWTNPADAAKTYTADSAVTPQNVTSYASDAVKDPGANINGETGTSAVAATAGQTGTAAQISDAEKAATQVSANTPTVTAQQVDQATPTDANTYDATKTQTDVANNQMTGATGTIKNQDLVTAEQEDLTGLATGKNADGSVNVVGEALNKYASQNLSQVIDTSTSAGQLLAAQLGDGNYIDSKATLQGQLAILQTQFVDPTTGEPKIPSWAASTARSVSKIMAFSGMTGTAATAAMSQALLEASLPIAQSDAAFYQTLTVKNLDNKQQSIINTANTLAKFEQSNLDNRQQAAVQNAQSFLAMDMKNLDNEQQAKVINNQSMIQSILADANAENVAKQFNATSKNQTDQFYASLNNNIAQFNASQTLTADQFNASMEDSRQKYNATNAYNIAVSNANWRQAVQMQDDQQNFEAATQDVKAATDLQTQQLNQIWDRSDSLLDYAFQQSENQKNRDATLALTQLQMKASTKNANMTALGSLAGNFVGSKTFDSMISGIF